jgi:hypothetical protein
MTEPTNDKILNRVRGLLDKANSTEFEDEAQALRDKAMELMAAYGIEQAMLEATGRKTADTIDTIMIRFKNPFSYEKNQLLTEISRALGCKPIMTLSGKSVLYTRVVGHRSDLEQVEFLYTLLLVQAENGAAKVKADSYSRYYTAGEVASRTRKLRASYLYGFADKVGERLTAIRAHAAAQNQAQHSGDSTPGTALVLASRMELVERAFENLFPDSRTRKGRTGYNATGYAAGQVGGRNADLGQGRFGAQAKALSR